MESTSNAYCMACGSEDHFIEDCENRDAFRQWLAKVKEAHYSAWATMVYGAALARRKDAVGDAAEVYGWSKTRADALGAAWEEVPTDFRWAPDLPLSAFRAALEAPEEKRWEALEMVADGASARDIRDHYDLTFYKRKVSRVPWLDDDRADVDMVIVEEDRAQVVLNTKRPTGQQPETVQVRAYRVLREDDDA